MSYLEEYWKQKELIRQTEELKELKKLRQVEKAARYSKLYGRQGSFPVTPIGGRKEGKSDFITSFGLALYNSFLDKERDTVPPSDFVYRAGVDPYNEKEESSSFPTEKLREQLNKQKRKNMKTKKFYHTFKFEQRSVTLCLLVEEQPQSFSERLFETEGSATIRVGYAVCVPEDKFDQKLAKRISLGRAESEKARIQKFSMGITKEFAFDLGILNATARIFERRIKRGDVVIKGIRPTKGDTKNIDAHEEER